jgi:hypothetical protein
VFESSDGAARLLGMPDLVAVSPRWRRASG